MTRTLGVLLVPDFQILDASGPIAAFEIASHLGGGAYRIRLLAKEAGPVASSSGVQMLAEAIDKAPMDTLLVAGGWGTRQAATCPVTVPG